ncbi:hypothetical protein AK812_SmicGene41975 [Symbiodinium microadriaticum]|uniref:Uncharacterized protein n=1 Tax=Symbiodinium microadriaticum TaxID=2951 RepID=A0A1Q9C4U1_SYMMI|nr:hypothetical protein AK812_SmicGene41975 [Symbiodinium microadriaticum]
MMRGGGEDKVAAGEGGEGASDNRSWLASDGTLQCMRAEMPESFFNFEAGCPWSEWREEVKEEEEEEEKVKEEAKGRGESLKELNSARVETEVEVQNELTDPEAEVGRDPGRLEIGVGGNQNAAAPHSFVAFLLAFGEGKKAYEPISRSQSLQPAETQEQYRQQVGMAAGRHPEVEELVLQSFESCDSWRFSGQVEAQLPVRSQKTAEEAGDYFTLLVGTFDEEDTASLRRERQYKFVTRTSTLKFLTLEVCNANVRPEEAVAGVVNLKAVGSFWSSLGDSEAKLERPDLVAVAHACGASCDDLLSRKPGREMTRHLLESTACHRPQPISKPILSENGVPHAALSTVP